MNYEHEFNFGSKRELHNWFLGFLLIGTIFFALLTWYIVTNEDIGVNQITLFILMIFIFVFLTSSTFPIIVPKTVSLEEQRDYIEGKLKLRKVVWRKRFGCFHKAVVLAMISLCIEFVF